MVFKDEIQFESLDPQEYQCYEQDYYSKLGSIKCYKLQSYDKKIELIASGLKWS